MTNPEPISNLKAQLSEWLDQAKEDAAEAVRVAGQNCYGAGFAEGEISAYEQVLEELEASRREPVECWAVVHGLMPPKFFASREEAESSMAMKSVLTTYPPIYPRLIRLSEVTE